MIGDRPLATAAAIAALIALVAAAAVAPRRRQPPARPPQLRLVGRDPFERQVLDDLYSYRPPLHRPSAWFDVDDARALDAQRWPGLRGGR